MTARLVLFVLVAALALPAGARGEARATLPADAVEGKDIRFWMDGENITKPRCSGCSRPTWVHIGSYKLSLRAPAGVRFARFAVAGDGRVKITGVSPNGRTVHATLHPGTVPGRHEIIAVFRRRDEVITSTKIFDVDGPRRGHDCEPSPCSDSRGYPDDHSGLSSRPRPPVPTCRVRAEGGLRFTADGATVSGAWPQRLRFAVALPDRVRGELATPVEGGPPERPQVMCTTGELLSVRRAPEVPGSRERFRVEVSSLPRDTDGWLVAGKHRCKVTYELRVGKRVRQRTGTLRFTIDGDGHMQTAKPRCPKINKPPPGAKKPGRGPQPASPADGQPRELYR